MSKWHLPELTEERARPAANWELIEAIAAERAAQSNARNALDDYGPLLRISIGRIEHETGMKVSTTLTRLLESGVEVLDQVMFKEVGKSGPLRGSSLKGRMQQLRDRDITVAGVPPRHAAVPALLLAWDRVPDAKHAQWLSSLVVGRDLWDGPYFCSSVVWSEVAMHPVTGAAVPAAATDVAAVGWAVAIDRLLNGDTGNARRDRIAATTLAYRSQSLRAARPGGGVPSSG